MPCGVWSRKLVLHGKSCNLGPRVIRESDPEGDAMKTNLTLRIDSNLLRDAKVLAARKGTSVSRLMADQLEDLVRQDRDYERARQRATARLQEGFDLDWAPPASRDELHER